MPRPAKIWLRKGRGWYREINGVQIKLATADEGYEKAKEVSAKLETKKTTIRYAQLSVPDLCDLFLRSQTELIKPSTIAWYNGHLNRFCRAKEHRTLRVRDVRRFHLTNWIAAQADWNGSTKRGAIIAVTRVFNWASVEGYLSENPFLKYKRPEMGVRSMAPPEDVAKVVAAITSANVREYVLALAETGARPGELAKATAESLNRQTRTLAVVGKAGPRTVTLNATAFALICDLAERRPAGPLFLTPRGKEWSTNAARLVFKRLRAKTGVANVTSYTFRHAFATEAVARNVNAFLVADLMGHKDLDMINKVYNHSAQSTLHEAAEQARKPAAS
jgi:integrase